MSAPTKYCINCEYSSFYNREDTFFCHHPLAFITIDRVTGQKLYMKCHDMRYGSAICGESAKLYQQRDNKIEH